jgi:hypothetical protein
MRGRPAALRSSILDLGRLDDMALETYFQASMASYKRNQIQDAIAALDQKGSRTDAELLTRMKRLLEADRALGRYVRANDPEMANFAFYSEEPPGTGVEVWFTKYEAFALFTALRVLEHGFPQGTAVRILRRIRPELEAHHARILKQDREILFDRTLARENAKAGGLVTDNSDPVFLTIISGGKVVKDGGSVSCGVCRGLLKVGAFVEREGGQSWTMFEIATPTWLLSRALAKTEPRKRGRGGG